MTVATEWQFAHFNDLSLQQLYAAMTLRQDVFVVEQNCPYLDADGDDLEAYHLLAWQDQELVACCRIIAPGIRYPEASIGRVVNARKSRGQGIGHELMRRAIAHCHQLYGNCSITISAQQYLEGFYQSLGFVTCSEPYLEDDIPHVKMTYATAALPSTQ